VLHPLCAQGALWTPPLTTPRPACVCVSVPLYVRIIGLAVDGDATGHDVRVLKKSGKVQALKELIQSMFPPTPRRPRTPLPSLCLSVCVCVCSFLSARLYGCGLCVCACLCVCTGTERGRRAWQTMLR
jgi:hypothetical protein